MQGFLVQAPEDNGSHAGGLHAVLYGEHLRIRPVSPKSKCCPNTPLRIVPRDVNENAHDYANALDGTPAFEESSNRCKKVEMRFAPLKTHHRFERMRLRGQPRI